MDISQTMVPTTLLPVNHSSHYMCQQTKSCTHHDGVRFLQIIKLVLKQQTHASVKGVCSPV